MISAKSRVLCLAIAMGITSPMLAQADGSSAPVTDTGSPTNCEQLLKKAQAALTRMPNGVEKTSARQELSSAKTDLAKGQASSCETHVRNAMTAMGSK